MMIALENRFDRTRDFRTGITEAQQFNVKTNSSTKLQTYIDNTQLVMINMLIHKQGFHDQIFPSEHGKQPNATVQLNWSLVNW